MRKIMIKTNPPNKEWLERGIKSGFTLDSGEPIWLPLKNILINIGGWGVCTSRHEPDMKNLISRGRKFPGKSISMRGQDSQCHFNSAMCWETNKDLCRICTGYALTRDGLWRQHSWIYTNEKRVVETTIKRVQYFGYILSPEECELFAYNQLT